MADLNEHLMEECLNDLTRIHSRLRRPVGELLEEEKKCLLPLPAQKFEACVQASTIATKLSLVRFDKNDYSVPVEYAHHMCIIKGFVDYVEISVEGQVVAKHDRCYGNMEFVLDWLHYVALLERKPGSLNNGRPFKGEPWGRDFEQMHEELKYRYESEGTKKFIKILLLFTEYPEREVKDAVRTCVKRCAFSDEAVRSVLDFQPREHVPQLDLAGWPELAGIGDGKRDRCTYDVLLAEAVPA